MSIHPLFLPVPPLLVVAAATVAQEPAPERAHYNTAVGLGGEAITAAPAIESGLDWLVAQQEENGSWNDDLEHTATVMLVFLGDGSTLRTGPHRAPLRRAVRWLRAQQAEDGRFGGAAASNVAHAMATQAIVEAYGLSQQRILEPCARAAVDHLLSLESADFAPHFAAAANVAVLAAADFELEIPDDYRTTWVDWWNQALAAVPATPAEGDEEPRTQALAMLPLVFLGETPEDNPGLRRAAQTITAYRPDELPTADYLSAAAYGAYQIGGATWRSWSKHHVPRILAARNPDGASWGQGADQVPTTAQQLLTLEAFYRYASPLTGETDKR